MATLTEGARTAAFLQSEANGYRSRETQVFDSTTDWAGAAIPAGQVYAIVGGVAVAFDGNASDGSEDAAGILYEGVDPKLMLRFLRLASSSAINRKDL